MYNYMNSVWFLLFSGVDVFICGGYNGELILADLWKINLQTFQWSKLPAVMPEPAYFHCAAVTPVSTTLPFQVTLWGGESPKPWLISVLNSILFIKFTSLSFLLSVPRLAACTSTVAWWTSMRTRELALCLRSGWLCPACWSYAGRSSSRPFPTWLHFPPCSCSTWASHRNSLNAWNRWHGGGRTNEWMGWAGLDREMTEHRI